MGFLKKFKKFSQCGPAAVWPAIADLLIYVSTKIHERKAVLYRLKTFIYRSINQSLDIDVVKVAVRNPSLI